MELRTAEIVTIGLELGLRASDVVRLKMNDIDWKNRRISVTQYKTQNALSLPLTTATGNAVYRYLVIILGLSEPPGVHSQRNIHKIYATPSIEMLGEAMNTANSTIPDETPEWEENEDELVRICGLR